MLNYMPLPNINFICIIKEMTDKDEKNYHSERSSRDKFKKERDDYSSRREDHDYYSSRRRRERSHSSGLSDHEERRSKRRRSSSPRGGDHYIPNYSRDGYDPAPRYQGNYKYRILFNI
ncbi:hypothetical protein H8356DRAFT_937255 [Neocallimastix lanati (nom. inval.)]|uniref:Uncharacterized protein n=1 Tax=Neocallimastix californiae TaxID=1754190 RepID=A0A1Y2EVD6_9FUNG|nr:hypothetical protein H8356DRAFT_937255 [Neocallimastix sp. JGI-2020a]ORY75529.1 hypothetical protein LY90DRAFT_131545 [Neocallimastix californiae]|eukprot:ORY75529.1 hypothetical protein LY90DRAFT_131545 [Neocallimastix californiae]